MTETETREFVLQPTSRRGRALSVRYERRGTLADLTVMAGGDSLFSGRVLSPFATILQTVAEMEESAHQAKEANEMMKYYGCMYIARHGRTQIAKRLEIPELAEYD